MPYYVIEPTASSIEPVRVQAANEAAALRAYLDAPRISRLLSEHDDESDPNRVYHGERTFHAWSFLSVSIAREICHDCWGELPDDWDDPDVRCHDCRRYDDPEEE